MLNLSLFSALVVDLIVIGSCKALFRRGRPMSNKDDMMTILVDKYSFPSGHTTRAALLACFLPLHFEIGLVGTGLVIVWALCVATSRILLGRHHVTDVVCGVIIGLIVYVLVERFLWLSQDQCMSIIRPMQEEIHL